MHMDRRQIINKHANAENVQGFVLHWWADWQFLLRYLLEAGCGKSHVVCYTSGGRSPQAVGVPGYALISAWEVMALPVRRILWKKNEVADYEATTFSIFYNNTLFLVLVIIASFFVLKNFNPTVYPFLPRLGQPRPRSCLLSLVPVFVSWAASGACRWVWFILVPQLRNTCV